MAPSASAGVQNGVDPTPPPLPADEPPVGPPADLYTADALYNPNTTGVPSSTVQAGGTAYFHIRTGGYIPPYGLATVAPGEADLVYISISGTTSAGAPFAITADRAAELDRLEYDLAFDIPSLMPGRLYVQSYRYVGWKVPPFMPTGNYTVQVWPYQTNGSTPRFFTAAHRNYAQGTLTVTARSITSNTLTLNRGIVPAAANPFFGFTWTPGFFSGSNALRTIIQNTTTGRYYCLAPGVEPYLNPFPPYHPYIWEANGSIPNTGSATVRYNSTATFGGQQLSPIPGGRYKVFLDDASFSRGIVGQVTTNPTNYLETAPGQFIDLQ